MAYHYGRGRRATPVKKIETPPAPRLVVASCGATREHKGRTMICGGAAGHDDPTCHYDRASDLAWREQGAVWDSCFAEEPGREEPRVRCPNLTGTFGPLTFCTAPDCEVCRGAEGGGK